MKKLFLLMCVITLATSVITSQVKDKGIFVEPKKGFGDEVQKSLREYNKKATASVKSFKVDLTNFTSPKSVDEFSKQWHNPPVSQGNTNTCWSFATTSFMESEVYRLTGKKVRLSETFTTYNEYLERVKKFVDERGNSAVLQVSEAIATPRIYKNYGCMPLEIYSGLQKGQPFHDHSKMFEEIKSYLDHIKATNAWDEEAVIKTVKSIMNFYLGTPPEKFVVDGKEFTPKTFLNDYLKLNPDDYIIVLSFMQKPFGEKVEFEFPDNWWHCKDFYNVPLDTFIKILKNAARKGFTAAIGGDVSEPGEDTDLKIYMVPSFDIPSDYIDDSARQFRFSNGTTNGNHVIHLVGYKEDKGKDWFLIKDSGSPSWNTDPKGYCYFTEDYVKLKIMTFLIHKDVVKGFIEVK